MGVMMTDLIFMGWVGCVEQERPPWIFPKLGKIHGGSLCADETAGYGDGLGKALTRRWFSDECRV
jgi:hypothetical protein